MEFTYQWKMFIDNLSSGQERYGSGEKERKKTYTVTGRSLVTRGQVVEGNSSRNPRDGPLVIFSIISYFTTFVPLKNISIDCCLSILYTINHRIDQQSDEQRFFKGERVLVFSSALLHVFFPVYNEKKKKKKKKTRHVGVSEFYIPLPSLRVRCVLFQ